MHGLADPSVGAGERASLPHRGHVFRLCDLIIDLLAVSISILQLLLLLLLVRVYFQLLGCFALLRRVRVFVESAEQEVEHNGMRSDEIGEGDREVALVLEEQLEGVDHHEHKLDLGVVGKGVYSTHSHK